MADSITSNTSNQHNQHNQQNQHEKNTQLQNLYHKLRLVGDSVQILSDRTLLRWDVKSKEYSIYEVKNNKAIEKCRYELIEPLEPLGDTSICITTNFKGLKGIVTIYGVDIIKPGYLSINTSVNGLLIVELPKTRLGGQLVSSSITGGLKAIIDYKGNNLTPYVVYNVKKYNTILGTILDITGRDGSINLHLVDYSEKINLIELTNINNLVSSDENYIVYNEIIKIIPKFSGETLTKSSGTDYKLKEYYQK